MPLPGAKVPPALICVAPISAGAHQNAASIDGRIANRAVHDQGRTRHRRAAAIGIGAVEDKRAAATHVQRPASCIGARAARAGLVSNRVGNRLRLAFGWTEVDSTIPLQK